MYENQNLLAIDPSINSCGVAMFQQGHLVAARTVVVPAEFKAEDIAKRCLRMGQEVMAWVHDLGICPQVLAAEWPQTYPKASSKINQSLIGLSGVIGVVSGILALGLAARNETLEVVSFLPAEWTYRLPKSKSGDPRASVRGRSIARRLDPLEATLFQTTKLNHDSVDAIGIGLHAVGRTAKMVSVP
jgi:hypothetical protein